MGDQDVRVAAEEIRRRYDLCTEAILRGDPDGFVAAFGPAGRGETADGVAITIAETYDYVAWRMAQTITVDSFVVVFDSLEGSADEVTVQFTEDSSAIVRDADRNPVVRAAHSVNRVTWKRENGEWNQVGGSSWRTFGPSTAPKSAPRTIRWVSRPIARDALADVRPRSPPSAGAGASS